MKYIKETIKIGDLFKILGLDNQKYEELQKSNLPIYIKTPNNEITPILGYVKKHVNLVKYTFIDNNNNIINLTCSDKHILIDEYGKNCLAKDINKCQSMYNGILTKINEEYIGEGDAYDISIKSPHLYFTTNGIIHHNTTYIRSLMYTLFKKKFMILDNSVFNYITDSSFIQLLINNQNAIIILEDCEEMLTDRVAGNNKLAALLNLSDGIIGDSFNFKFICTFNSNISKLDPAIMRKGRMKLKYEFKKLDKKKVQVLAKKLNKDVPNEDMTLADLFNYGEDNGVKQEKKIGFGN